MKQVYCKNDQCPKYMKDPFCFNHAYILCPQYEQEADLRENLRRIYNNQGLEHDVEDGNV